MVSTCMHEGGEREVVERTVRGHVMRDAIRRNQTQSDAIRAYRAWARSEAIRGNQRQSVVERTVRGHDRPFRVDVLAYEFVKGGARGFVNRAAERPHEAEDEE